MDQILFILILYFTDGSMQVVTVPTADVATCGMEVHNTTNRVFAYNATHDAPHVNHATMFCLDLSQGKEL